jgi:alkylhydroperoxidase family enzyme
VTDQISIRSDLIENFERTWANLAGPGAVWTGAQRLAMAAEARRARNQDPPGSALPPAAIEAVRLLAASPAAARRGWVEALVAAGLDEQRYVELLGVVARLVAVDTLYEALGMPFDLLPEPVAGEPSGEISTRTRPGKGWVPMVGGASITQALSLIPSENAELERFHGPMYLTFQEMSDPTIARGLTRPQMELVAARTSAFNECFY